MADLPQQPLAMKEHHMCAVPLNRYQLLDAFRGLAILLIMCVHLMADDLQKYENIWNCVLDAAYVGLSSFFVISGYCAAISMSQEIYRKRPVLFMWHRFKRVYSTYWWHLLFVVLIIPFFSAALTSIKTKAFSFRVIEYSLYDWFGILTLSKVFSASDWAINRAFLPLNGVLWYIAVIVQIYLFMTICLYFGKYLRALLVVSFLVSFGVSFESTRDIVPYGLFLPYFCQFCVGIFVYSLLSRNVVPNGRFQEVLIVLMLVGLLYFLAHNDNRLFRMGFSPVVGLAMLLLHKYDAEICRSYVFRVLCLVGISSYSIYLLHVPMGSFVDMFVRRLGAMPYGVDELLLMMPIVVVLCFFWYLFFEKPHTQREVLRRVLAPIRTIRNGTAEAVALLRQ